MRLEALPFDQTIGAITAKEIALEIQEYEDQEFGEREYNRVEYAARFPEVKTVDDYMTVSLLADALLEKTDLELGDLFGHETRWGLVSTVITAYMNTVVIRDLFQVVDIETPHYELPVMNRESMAPAPVEEDGEFPVSEASYETKEFHMEKLTGSAHIGSTVEPRPTLGEIFEQFAELIYSQIDQTIGEPKSVGNDAIDALYQGFNELHSEAYRPEKVIIGTGVWDVVEEKFVHTADDTTSKFQIMGAEATISDRLPPNEIIVADPDHVGYEGVWDDLQGRFSDYMGLHRDEPFYPMRLEFWQRMNWIRLYDDSFVRLRV